MPRVPKQPRRHAGEHDLIEAFGLPGCPVCRLASEAVDAYLTAVCYEQVNDLDLRAQLREAGGFCRVHAHRFLRQRLGQLASAIVYRDVLNTARGRIRDHAPGRAGPFLGGLLGRRAPRNGIATGGAPNCPACAALAEAEERHVGTLRSRITDPDVLGKYRAGDGLCLPHLDRALDGDGEGPRLLTDAAVESLGTLVAELDEYIRKHDYRFQDETLAGQEDVPGRAIERAVGRADPDG
jgi:hypothetical protein